jgi:hypothetical protein
MLPQALSLRSGIGGQKPIQLRHSAIFNPTSPLPDCLRPIYGMRRMCFTRPSRAHCGLDDSSHIEESHRKYSAGGFSNVCNKTYFTYDAFILCRLGCSAKRRSGRRSGGQRVSRIRGPGSSRWKHNTLWEHSDAARRHLDSDHSKHRPRIKLSQPTDAWQ